MQRLRKGEAASGDLLDLVVHQSLDALEFSLQRLRKGKAAGRDLLDLAGNGELDDR